MRVVGVFLEHKDTFALLLRSAHKRDGGTWGLPSGQVEDDETDEEAALRELFEETGYQGVASQLEHLGNFEFTTSSGEPSVYATYRLRLSAPHDIVLEDNAHDQAIWVTIEEADSMNNLIHGQHDLFRYLNLI